MFFRYVHCHSTLKGEFFCKKVKIHINSVNFHFFHFCLLNLMKNSVYNKKKKEVLMNDFRIGKYRI